VNNILITLLHIKVILFTFSYLNWIKTILNRDGGKNINIRKSPAAHPLLLVYYINRRNLHSFALYAF